MVTTILTLLDSRRRLIEEYKARYEILEFVKKHLIGKRFNQYQRTNKMMKVYFENSDIIENVTFRRNTYSNYVEYEFIFHLKQYGWSSDDKMRIDFQEYWEEDYIDKKMEYYKEPPKEFTYTELERDFETLFYRIEQVNEIVATINNNIGGKTFYGSNSLIYNKCKGWKLH
jgi:hypothetical protein